MVLKSAQVMSLLVVVCLGGCSGSDPAQANQVESDSETTLTENPVDLPKGDSPQGPAKADETSRPKEAAPGRIGLVTDGGHTGLVTGVEQSPDGKYLVSCDYEKQAIVWEVPSQKVVKRLQFDERCRCVTYYPNGSSVCIGVEDQVRVYDTQSWQLRKTVHTKWKPDSERDSAYVTSVSFSPDGKRIVVALRVGYHPRCVIEVWSGGGSSSLWEYKETRDGEPLGALIVDDDICWLVFLDGHFQKWNYRTGEMKLRVNHPQPFEPAGSSQIQAACYCPRLNAIIAGTKFHRILVINAADGKLISRIEDPAITKKDDDGNITGAEWCGFICVSEDGEWAVTGGGSQNCNIWNLKSKALHSRFPADVSFGEAVFLAGKSQVAVLSKNIFLIQQVP